MKVKEKEILYLDSKLENYYSLDFEKLRNNPCFYTILKMIKRGNKNQRRGVVKC